MSALAIEEASASSKTDAAVADGVENGVKRELRVLHVFDSLGMGGAETWLMALLRYFQRENERSALKVYFDVLLTGGNRAVFDEEAESLGARLFYLPFTRKALPAFARNFRRILRDGRYDAIHDHQDYIAGLHFAMGAGLLPPVRIAHVHNPLYHRITYATGLIRRTTMFGGRTLISRMATHVMGTSKQIVCEYGFSDSATVGLDLGAAHCGFDVSSYQGDHSNAHAELCREFGWVNSAKIILFVGRLEGSELALNGQVMTHKNPAFALDVVRQCMAKDETVHLLMVGAGNRRKKQFEEMVKAWGLQSQIKFLGVRSDIPRLMLGSNLLLFPSVAEGLGMVVVEAQATGLRVLASDSTPAECVVVPDLVTFLSLKAAPSTWVENVLRLTHLPRCGSDEPNRAVSESSFSIQHSATRLSRLYGGGPY